MTATVTEERKDQVMPAGKWQFDEEVTDVFDEMLGRSIPQYEAMRKACFDLAMRYRTRGTHIVDLGCSRGEAISELVYALGVNNRFVGVEISEPMLRAARTRFQGMPQSIVDIRQMDLRQEYPPVAASVTLCVLTLVFTPINYRAKILQNIYDHTNEGGALIFVEKILGDTAELDEHMIDIYYEMKAANGYTAAQIEAKRHSLEGVQVPLTARFNEDMLRRVGFKQVDCFWRWMNFAGWVAVR